MSHNKENEGPSNAGLSHSNLLTQSSDRDTSRRPHSENQRNFFIKSIRETDDKIKKLFDDILEERRNTHRTLKENFEKIITPTNRSFSNQPDKIDNSSFFSSSSQPGKKNNNTTQNLLDLSGLQTKKHGKNNKSQNAKFSFALEDKEGSPQSNNTSILLKDEDNEDLNLSPTQNAQASNILSEIDLNRDLNKPKSKPSIPNIFPAKTSKPNLTLNNVEDNSEDDGLDDVDSLNSSLEHANDTLSFSLKKHKQTLNITTDSKRYIDEKLERLTLEEDMISPSSTNMLGTLKEGDFNLHPISSSKHKPDEGLSAVLQLSKHEIDLGSMYHTQVREETLEIFNRGKDCVSFEISVESDRESAEVAEVVFTLNKDTRERNRDVVKLEKFSFISVKIVVRGRLCSRPKARVEYKLNIVGRAEESAKESRVQMPIRGIFEAPNVCASMGSLDTYYDDNVPVISLDLESQSKSEFSLPFKNKGERSIVLEFEGVVGVRDSMSSVTGRGGLDVLYSSRFLSLGGGEEKTVGVTVMRRGLLGDGSRSGRGENGGNGGRVVLKVKVKETRLAMFFVVQAE